MRLRKYGKPERMLRIVRHVKRFSENLEKYRVKQTQPYIRRDNGIVSGSFHPKILGLREKLNRERNYRYKTY